METLGALCAADTRLLLATSIAEVDLVDTASEQTAVA